MKKSNYSYKNPINNGFVKFKLTKKEYNKFFKNNKINFFHKIDCYYSEDKKTIKIEKFINNFSIFINLLMFPFVFILFGVLNYKNTINEYKIMLNQKKYGNFMSYTIFDNDQNYQEIFNIINK